jgi:hypothetical protein
MKQAIVCVAVFALGCALAWTTTQAQMAKKASPADGHDIHVVAPHVVDGVVMGPYHHYCKAVSPEILECLIYESTEPNALMTQVEYMINKSVTRTQLDLSVWNKYYHDHVMEIATGRVQVLDRTPEEAAKIAEAAKQTDGIIFHLWWPHMAAAPNGEVKHAQAISHRYLTEAEWKGPVGSPPKSSK